MKTKSDRKIAVLVLSVMAAGFLLSACGPKTPEQTGRIYLYGEIHDCEIIYEKERCPVKGRRSFLCLREFRG